jgi:hypothetical protein
MTPVIQTIIVLVCVGTAAIYVLARYLPRARFAAWFARRGHDRFAELVKPARSQGCHDAGSGGASGCGSCGSCGTSSQSNEQPLRFHKAR